MSKKKTENEQVLANAAGGEQGEEVAVPGEYGGPTLNDLSRQRIVEKPKDKESKASRFKRLALRRVPKAIRALKHVENLGNTSQYAYTDTQRDKIVETLGIAAQRVYAAFHGKAAEADQFSL